MNELTVTETMSPTIGKLVNALCKAQAAMKPAVKDTSNPFFKSKYADLSAVWEAIRSPLTDHGLAVIQAPAESNGDVVILDTLLAHESGEWIKSRLCMRPAKSDPQGIGSCLTYARRYALGAIAGVATEEDDDGNAASKPNGVKQTALRDKVIEKVVVGKVPAITREQFEKGLDNDAIQFMDRHELEPYKKQVAGPVPASVPTSEPPQALPPPTADEKPWQKGIVTAITQNEKLTRAKKPWGTITLETIEGSTVEATWFGFSHPWSYETIKEQLCGTLLDVEYVLTPANDPKYKPTLEHIRVPQ